MKFQAVHFARFGVVSGKFGIGLMVSFVLEIEDRSQCFEKRLRLIGSEPDKDSRISQNRYSTRLTSRALLSYFLTVRGVNHSWFCGLVK